ncbi:MAG: efflux RND transporter periplasmic adaptor subunit [Xanthomonadales bacterium]|nr:efflux RND transporter periplasmic adaptor subunit [Xanthomonadales bacterium]
MNKMTLAWLAALPTVFLLGYWLNGHLAVTPTTPPGEGAEESEPQVLYWVAPMDPQYRRDKPGKSPMGMDLVPVYASEEAAAADVDSIHINPAVENNLGVRTSVAEFRVLPETVQATAHVAFDENRQSHVHVRTPGWIESLAVEYVGERVKKGQLLFEFYAPEIVNAQKEYLHARGRGEESIRRAAREKLITLGVLEEDIEQLDQRGTAAQTIRVRAAQDGVVVAMHAREGMYLKPEMDVFSLAELSSVWMIADVFEVHADAVRPGQKAEARLKSLPGDGFSGAVDYVYPVLDPETRTLRVRLSFANPDERLKPNMYGTVTITGGETEAVLVIPRDALIRTADNNRVIVSLGEGQYQAREVHAGRENDQWVHIIEGLEVGERVVTSAQFMLDSEASLSASLRRLQSPQESGEADGHPFMDHAGMHHD